MPLVKLSWLAFEFYLTLLSYLLVSLFYNLQAVYKERKFIKKVRMNIVTDYILRSYARLLCTSILYYVFWFCRCETAVYFDQCIQALCGFWAGWHPWTHNHPRTCTHFMRSFLWVATVLSIAIFVLCGVFMYSMLIICTSKDAGWGTWLDLPIVQFRESGTYVSIRLLETRIYLYIILLSFCCFCFHYKLVLWSLGETVN